MTPTPSTPAARALVGCQALVSDDSVSVKHAAKLAGYDITVASPVFFGKAGCYRRGENVRVVVRNGRIVRVSGNATALTAWLMRLGRKLSYFDARRRS